MILVHPEYSDIAKSFFRKTWGEVFADITFISEEKYLIKEEKPDRIFIYFDENTNFEIIEKIRRNHTGIIFGFTNSLDKSFNKFMYFDRIICTDAFHFKKNTHWKYICKIACPYALLKSKAETRNQDEKIALILPKNLNKKHIRKIAKGVEYLSVSGHQIIGYPIDDSIDVLKEIQGKYPAFTIYSSTLKLDAISTELSSCHAVISGTYIGMWLGMLSNSNVIPLTLFSSIETLCRKIGMKTFIDGSVNISSKDFKNKTGNIIKKSGYFLQLQNVFLSRSRFILGSYIHPDRGNILNKIIRSTSRLQTYQGEPLSESINIFISEKRYSSVSKNKYFNHIVDSLIVYSKNEGIFIDLDVADTFLGCNFKNPYIHPWLGVIYSIKDALLSNRSFIASLNTCMRLIVFNSEDSKCLLEFGKSISLHLNVINVEFKLCEELYSGEYSSSYVKNLNISDCDSPCLLLFNKFDLQDLYGCFEKNVIPVIMTQSQDDLQIREISEYPLINMEILSEEIIQDSKKYLINLYYTLLASKIIQILS